MPVLGIFRVNHVLDVADIFLLKRYTTFPVPEPTLHMCIELPFYLTLPESTISIYNLCFWLSLSLLQLEQQWSHPSHILGVLGRFGVELAQTRHSLPVLAGGHCIPLTDKLLFCAAETRILGYFFYFQFTVDWKPWSDSIWLWIPVFFFFIWPCWKRFSSGCIISVAFMFLSIFWVSLLFILVMWKKKRRFSFSISSIEMAPKSQTLWIPPTDYSCSNSPADQPDSCTSRPALS